MVFYFSATGNSKYVAERIAQATGEAAVPIVDLHRGEDFLCQVRSGESLGFVSPTYAGGIPDIMENFLRGFRLAYIENHYTYFVSTYGTTPGTSDSFADSAFKASTGLNFRAFYSVRMPDTWTPAFDLSDRQKVAEINQAAESQIDEIIRHIGRRSSGNFMRDRLPGFTRAFVRPFYDRLRRTKHLRVEEGCTGCGLCVKKCPIRAITMKGGVPCWIEDRCTMCLGCLHRCPQFAIQYGRATRKHGQYHNPNTKV